jgi:hypothetical protein
MTIILPRNLVSGHTGATHSGIDWSPWIALASFVGVLVATLLTGWFTRRAADRNAQALLDVESRRTATEHRRHLRGLVADVASTGAAYVGATLGEFREGTPSTDVHQVRQNFERAVALVFLASSNPSIVKALDEIEDAVDTLNQLRYDQLGNEGNEVPVSILAALFAKDGIQERCDALITAARAVLADPTGATPEM